MPVHRHTMAATSGSIMLELSFDLHGNQTSSVLRQLDAQPDPKPTPNRTQICRVCLRQCPTGSKIKMRPIFEASGDTGASVGETLADLMEQCASIQTILPDDTTPQHICAPCESRLHIAVQFKLQCERSDLQFRTEGVPVRWDATASDDESCRIKHETTEFLGDMHQCNSGTESSSTTEPRNNVDENANVSAPNRCKRMRTTPEPAAATPPTAAALLALRTRRLPPPVLQCQECDRVFTKKDSYTVHMRKHTGERPFVCDICQSAFKTYSAISAHMTTHSSVRQFACARCPFRTKTRENLRVHERLHDPHKAYACRHCPQRFRSNSNMHKHERSKHCGGDGTPASGRRRYRCDQCDQTFGTNDSLRRHRVRHSGAKPYVCTVCQRAYGWHTGLKRHMDRHHVGVPVPMEKAYSETPVLPLVAERMDEADTCDAGS